MTEKISSSWYYDIKEMYNIEIAHKNKSLFLFHINACPFKVGLSPSKKNFILLASLKDL